MKRIFIIRHGTVDYCDKKVEFDRIDIRIRLEKLAENITDLVSNNTKVFSSTEHSAAYSAGVLSNVFQKNLKLCPELIKGADANDVIKLIGQNISIDSIILVTHLDVIDALLDSFNQNGFICPSPVLYLDSDRIWYTNPCDGWLIDLDDKYVASISSAI